MTDYRALGRIGGLRLHLTHDSREVSAPGRKAAADKLNARLLAVIDPDGTLPEATRERELTKARSRYFREIRARRELKRTRQ